MTPFKNSVMIGSFLRQKRKEKGLTIKEMASLIGRSNNFIYGYEKGEDVNFLFQDIGVIFSVFDFDLKDKINFCDLFSSKQRNKINLPLENNDMHFLLENIILGTDKSLSFEELYFLIVQQTIHSCILEPWVIDFYIKDYRVRKTFAQQQLNEKTA